MNDRLTLNLGWLGILWACAIYPATGLAAGFTERVELEHLAELSDAALEALKEPEHAVGLARIRLEGAKAELARSRGQLILVRQRLVPNVGELPDLDGERKEPRSTGAIDRLRDQLGSAARQRLLERRFSEWQEQRVVAREALIRVGRARLAQAQADWSLAAVRALAHGGASSARLYDQAAFESTARRRRAALASVEDTAQAEVALEELRREAWQRASTSPSQ